MHLEHRHRLALLVCLAVAALVALPDPAWARPTVLAPPADTGHYRFVNADADAAAARWRWPLTPRPPVTRPFDLPARYGPGHRGIDLGTAPGSAVFAVEAGTVRFRGTVVDRPVLSIQHADGLISTYEPVTSQLSRGDPVSAGDRIGEVSTAHHHEPNGGMHLGAKVGDDYLDPRTLLGAPRRAVLLPLGE